MQTNHRGKIIAIFAVLLVFLYGIFGIPHGSLKQTLTDRIHLGLDLRGGTHLVLQVHTNEAITARAQGHRAGRNCDQAGHQAACAGREQRAGGQE